MDATKRRILEAAGPFFAERGYQAATVRDICQRAGVNLAAVNYHFGDKERLYIETVKHACASRMEEAPLPDWPAGTSATVKLRDFIRILLLRMLDEGAPSWHSQLMVRELAQPTAACAEWVRDTIKPMADVLNGILNELLPRKVSLAQRYLIAFSIVGQCFYYKLNKPIVALLVGEEQYRRYTTELLTEHIARFSLAALGHEQPLTEARSS